MCEGIWREANHNVAKGQTRLSFVRISCRLSIVIESFRMTTNSAITTHADELT
jgi:hypothetical protein